MHEHKPMKRQTTTDYKHLKEKLPLMKFFIFLKRYLI